VGILQTLKLVDSIADPVYSTPSITAQYNPPIMDSTISNFIYAPNVFVSRAEAMAVPTVARARNLIAGTIATLPLHLYRKSTGEELGSPRWLEQPDYRQPRSVTLSATVDALFHFGVAYWEVTEVYEGIDGRPSAFAFVNNDRVSFNLNQNNTEVENYLVDGVARPQWGIGSLITFQGINEGILNNGGRTIRAALDLEKAAAIAAATPIPSGYISNSGSDLPPDQITGLLSQWKLARQQRSTAFLSASLQYHATSFSPKDMMYSEAAQHLSTQLARLCNIPAYMVSSEMNNSMTYSNVMDERRQFVDMTLKPLYAAIEDRLSMNDITNSQNYVRFSVDDTYLRSDALTRLAILEKMLALNLITVDQARGMEDLTPEGDNSNAD
jgi:HK97 family phage portal protein